MRDPAIFGLVLIIAVGLMIMYRWMTKPAYIRQTRPTINVIEMRALDPGNFEDTPADTAMLLWRLYPDQTRRSRGVIHPGFIHAHRTPNSLFVFMTIGDKAHVLEDDPALFPSDTLVTKIRLLR